MRSSIAIASLCAAVAVASPLVKKGYEVVETHVDVVTNVVMVTVTAEPVTVTAGAANTPAPVVVTVAAPAKDNYWQQLKPQAPTQAPVPEIPSVAPVTPQEAAPAPVVAPAPSPAAPVASATDALSPSAVSSHNDARASHQAEPMAWNQTLADFAAQEGSCSQFAHDLTAGGGGYGQNIAVAGNSNSGAHTTESALADAIKEWYAEESLYGALYGQASPPQSVGDFLHFTQMVWKRSLQVGCAVKTCGTDNSIYPGMYIWYSVCNYYPAGNVLGEFDANVLS